VIRMRILLIGKTGGLGWELERCLAPLGAVIAVGREDLDLRQKEHIPTFIDRVRPDCIINAAAYTDVDRAESEPEMAQAVNAVAPTIIAEEARRRGAFFFHYSTDYVFDGNKAEPYLECDAAHPLNQYGRTKWEGEQAVQAVGGSYLILRTSWLYGMRTASFPTKVLGWARTRKVLRIVEDQVGSPTWCRMLAEKTAALLGRGRFGEFQWLTERSGLYHVAARGAVSRYEWAKWILELDPHHEEQIVERLDPARTEEFPTPAERPGFSALDCGRFEEVFDLALPAWESSLRDAMTEKVDVG
jgi:dTDP-4-dehydrorhamnose reductase